MTHYAVGDIQGCYQELRNLLTQVAFNPRHDHLWVVGDLVNRGPESAATLKFLYNNRDSVSAVLGNHDLALLAIYYGHRNPKRGDTIDNILSAKQSKRWINWLRTLPLCYYDKTQGYAMVHAGIAPQWSLRKALALSKEVEQVLQCDNIDEFLAAMFGNEPALWQDKLTGLDRLRCITNYFTRMRIVNRNAALELDFKGDLHTVPKNYYAWFNHPQRKTANQSILFGHWASLGGYVKSNTLYGLDTGCVWGAHLTLMNLETNEFTVAQSQY
jgi:bis(5'-nucleosyl)-tetraphosphatase (symmetrical)